MADMSIPSTMAPLAALVVPREWNDGANAPETTPQPLIEAPSTDDGGLMGGGPSEDATPLAPPVADLSDEDEELGGPTVGLHVPAHLFPAQNPFLGPDPNAPPPVAPHLPDLAADGEPWDDATGAMARPQLSHPLPAIDESALSADSAVESPDFLNVPFDPRARQGGGAFGSPGQDNYGQSGGVAPTYGQPPGYPQGYGQQGYGQQGYAPPDAAQGGYVPPAYAPQTQPQAGYGPPGYPASDPSQGGFGPQEYPHQQGDYGPAGHAAPDYPQAEYPSAGGAVPGSYGPSGPPTPHDPQPAWPPPVVPDYGAPFYPAAVAPEAAPAPTRASHPDGGPELASDDLLDDDVEDVEDVLDAELLDDDDGRP